MRALSSWLQGQSRGARPVSYGYDAANQGYTLVSMLRMVAPLLSSLYADEQWVDQAFRNMRTSSDSAVERH
jgi:hypothetical protein